MIHFAMWLAVFVATPGGATLAQPEARAASPVTAAQIIPNFTRRLEGLSPERPRGYFELGEEVAAETKDPTDRRLARQLFVLAYETQRGSAGKPGAKPADSLLGPSVCLALAGIADNDEERRWLVALAGAVGGEGAQATLEPGGVNSARDGAALELASAIGLIRSGEGRRAQKILEKPAVGELLDKYERLLSPGGLTGGAARIRKLAGEWPSCSECRNRRYIKGTEGVRICPSCGGKPGPQLSQVEVVYQLRLESFLLHGVRRSWAAQTIADGGAPLRDLDPVELAATYQVDPAKPVWRNGQWSASAPAAAPEKRP